MQALLYTTSQPNIDAIITQIFDYIENSQPTEITQDTLHTLPVLH